MQHFWTKARRRCREWGETTFIIVLTATVGWLVGQALVLMLASMTTQ